MPVLGDDLKIIIIIVDIWTFPMLHALIHKFRKEPLKCLSAGTPVSCLVVHRNSYF